MVGFKKILALFDNLKDLERILFEMNGFLDYKITYKY
jgi:hypothetical protein